MDDCKDRDILVVTTTVPTLAQAQALGRALVEARLAACVQLEPGLQSFYRWQDRVCDDPEVRLTIKTLPARAGELQAFLARHHPYDVPQFVAQRMEASPAYFAWVGVEVS
jgi:periplasmic divalent cation tolerance protein